jgi:hypothetical protein
MIVIVGHRQRGKTERLLNLMRADDSIYMIVHDHHTGNMNADRSGLSRRRFITIRGLAELNGIDSPRLVIDNAELCLASFFTFPLDAISVTPDTILNPRRD